VKSRFPSVDIDKLKTQEAINSVIAKPSTPQDIVSRRIFTNLARSASKRVTMTHWFNKLDLDDRARWLESKVHWTIDVDNIVDILTHQE